SIDVSYFCFSIISVEHFGHCISICIASHYIKKTCHWLLTNLPNLGKTKQKHGFRLFNTLGISTNSLVNIMLHAILQTKTGYQTTLISHTHHYYYPQFFIGRRSSCILTISETQLDSKCNRLWS